MDRKRAALFVDVSRPFPYSTGLLNRMTIPAIAASPFIRYVENHEAWDRRLFQLCN